MKLIHKASMQSILVQNKMARRTPPIPENQSRRPFVSEVVREPVPTLPNLEELASISVPDPLAAAEVPENVMSNVPEKRPERPHKCPHCPYAAKYSSHIKDHVKAVHDKTRDFECTECSWGSNRKKNLMAHLLR